jgi:DNA-binding transcriptional MerR regulator
MSKSAEAFRTISEVAGDLDVPKHVLRFWEAKFPQIRPMKRGGGRRYYRPEDLELLRGIRHLLHAEGYTIKGVQKILREQGIDQVKGFAGAPAAETPRGGAARKARRASAAKPAAVAAADAAPAAAKRAVSGAAPATGDVREAVTAAIVELEACRRLLTDGKAAPAQAAPAKTAPTKVAKETAAPRVRAARG